jgi:hypothetical protein
VCCPSSNTNAVFEIVEGNRNSSNFLAGMEHVRLDLLSFFVVFTDSSFLQQNNNKHGALCTGAAKIGIPCPQRCFRAWNTDFPSVFQIKIDNNIIALVFLTVYL